MIPGMGKAVKDVDIDEDAFKGIEAIICSMTKKEREDLKQDLELLSKEELIEILLDHEEKRSK